MSGPRVSRGPYLGFREARAARARMRALRRAAGLTQAQLAENLGHATAWVAVREQGKRSLAVTEAEQVAKALGTDLAGLTEGKA